MENDRPIGIFDSGLGGLSVYREIRTVLPGEDVIYFADNAYCPYGTRPPHEINQRCEVISRMLLKKNVKVVVVACNTASSVSIWHLREIFPGVEFIGLEPAVKPAVERSKTGRVGVLATPRTVAGERLRWLIERFANGVEVLSVAATGLVELVEAGVLSGPDVDRALQPLLDPMIDAGVDGVVLGCTHYPFLREAIQQYIGPDIDVIDSGKAIAMRTEFLLAEANALTSRTSAGGFQLMTSGDAGGVASVASMLLGYQVIATSLTL
ncbi:MAG: glutamate racemase [Thermomicrobiales bacterium]